MEGTASRDSLTKFYKAKPFFELVGNEIVRSKRFGRPLAFFILRFKPSSSQAKNFSQFPVLKKCSYILGTLIRQIDIPGRIGDKLSLAVPETGRNGALGMANRILDQVKGLRFTGEDYEFGISCEIGISVYPEDGVSADDLLKVAEEALDQKPIKG